MIGTMLPLVEQHRHAIAALCRRFGVRRLELFGSAASGEFDPDTSDLDFFVEFDDAGGHRGSAARYFGLLHALEDLFGRPIDLVEPSAVRNRYFMQEARRHTAVVYAA